MQFLIDSGARFHAFVASLMNVDLDRFEKFSAMVAEWSKSLRRWHVTVPTVPTQEVILEGGGLKIKIEYKLFLQS